MAYGVTVATRTDLGSTVTRGEVTQLRNRLQNWADASADRQIVSFRYQANTGTFYVTARLTGQAETDLDPGIDTVADLIDGNLDTVVPFQHANRTQLKEEFVDIEGGF